MVVFDTARGDVITVEHLLASCGFLPEFAPVEIGGRLLGDGGLSANAPIEALMFDDRHAGERVCFVVDLFARDGARPTGLESAFARKNDLLFGNQTRIRLDAWRRELELSRALESASGAAEQGRSRVRAIVHLSYRPPPHEAGPEKMFDLSRATVSERWRAGCLDAEEAMREVAAMDLDSSACVLRSIRRS
jgi:NTE family protein